MNEICSSHSSKHLDQYKNGVSIVENMVSSSRVISEQYLEQYVEQSGHGYLELLSCN